MRKKLLFLAFAVITAYMLVGCGKKREFAECDKMRKSIEEKYGITILYGDDKVEAKELKGAKMLSDETRIDTSLDEIDTFFSKLPDGFLDELEKYSGKSFLVVMLDQDLSGVIMDGVKEEHWVVDCSMVTSSLALAMMHSIYWHVEHADEDLGFLKDWYRYNPSDFEYGNPDKYKKYLFGNGNDYESYFAIEGEMESMIDDVRWLFKLLWDEEAILLKDTTLIPKIRAKMRYICSELDRVFETVDENAYWARYIK